MSLLSSKEIHGYEWDEFPVDDEVISRVEELARLENQTIL